jgi:hypothetical protein
MRLLIRGWRGTRRKDGGSGGGGGSSVVVVVHRNSRSRYATGRNVAGFLPRFVCSRND